KLEPLQGGAIRFNGTDTSKLSKDDRKKLRSDISIVFQDPMASLDPRLPISDSLREPMRVQGYSDKTMDERIEWLLDTVGLLPEHADRYPHEFSGGQRQRIGVARALSDRKSTRLNSSHVSISYAVFCLKKKRTQALEDRTHM